MFCKTGSEVVELVKGFLKQITASNSQLDTKNKARPVSLILMDINMPLKSGLEAKKEITELYENSNKALSERTQEDDAEASVGGTKSKTSIIRPLICYQT